MTPAEGQNYLLLARSAARLRTAQDHVLKAADEMHYIVLDYRAELQRAVDAAQAEVDRMKDWPTKEDMEGTHEEGRDTL